MEFGSRQPFGKRRILSSLSDYEVCGEHNYEGFHMYTLRSSVNTTKHFYEEQTRCWSYNIIVLSREWSFLCLFSFKQRKDIIINFQQLLAGLAKETGRWDNGSIESTFHFSFFLLWLLTPLRLLPIFKVFKVMFFFKKNLMDPMLSLQMNVSRANSSQYNLLWF